MSTVRRAALSAALLCLLLTANAARAACAGDCDGSGTVDVSELIKGVNIALGSLPISACPVFDSNNDQTVAVNELIAAVNAALGGCPAVTPTATTGEPTPTPTVAIEPIFPADYRDTYIEVRDCRLGIEHGGEMIRVVANSIAAQPYLQLKNPLPVGSIVVKEEYDLSATDCSDPTKIMSWSAMRKETPGFDPASGDWHWQRVSAPARGILCAAKDDCRGFTCTSVGCHAAPECLARDYMCTANITPRGTLQPVLENLPAAILSISGTAPTDVYAVGADPQDTNGPYVVHYDGSGWTRLKTGASGDLWWISVTPIDGDFYMAGAGGLILQFDPSSGKFTQQTTPDNTSQLFGVWGTAANNLWAVGGDSQNQAALWHYDGMHWTAVDVSALLPSGEGSTTLYKVWGRSASDVFAVGEAGIVLHYDGMNWSSVTSGVSNALFTVHGSGARLDAVGGFLPTGIILEQKSDGSLAFDMRAPSGTQQLNGVFVPPNGNAVAVGNSLSVAARDSSGWSLVNDGTAETQGRDFHGTWVDADDGIWAVGGDLSTLKKGILSYGGPDAVAGGQVQ